MIKCTLCTEEDLRFGRKELRDHIAAFHLFYIRHRCVSCDLKSLETTTLWEHFGETGHRVMFNKVWVERSHLVGGHEMRTWI